MKLTLGGLSLIAGLLLMGQSLAGAQIYREGSILRLYGPSLRNESCSVTRVLYNPTDQPVEFSYKTESLLDHNSGQSGSGVLEPSESRRIVLWAEASTPEERGPHSIIWNERVETELWQTLYEEDISSCPSSTTTPSTTTVVTPPSVSLQSTTTTSPVVETTVTTTITTEGGTPSTSGTQGPELSTTSIPRVPTTTTTLTTLPNTGSTTIWLALLGLFLTLCGGLLIATHLKLARTAARRTGW